MSFSPVRLDGGGCCNVHALSPDKSKLVAGSDTQGYYLTTTATLGNKWTVQNTGVGKQVKYRQCAAIMWSATETSPQVIYAGTGDKGAGGGLLAGTYNATTGTITWALRSGVPQWAGNQVGPSSVLPHNGWQRSTGRLLFQDSLFLFAGTFNQGVLRSSNTGGTGVPGSDDFPVACQMGGAAPGTGNWYCRAVVPDPAVAATMWAGFYDSTGTGARLWKCANSHDAAPNFTQVAGGPAAVEDIFAVGDFLYVAAANDGVWRYGPLSGVPAWADLTGGQVPTAASNWWMTVTGHVDGSANHVIVAGDSNPAAGQLAKTLMKLTVPSNYPTGSITYTSLTGSVQVTNVPTGPTTSYSWWLPAAGLHVYLGGGGYICPQANVDATNPAAPKYYCAGSGGCYRDVGSGWTVANSGMPQFLGHPVAASPARAGHLVWGDSDWCLFDDTNPGAENASTLLNDPPVSSTQGQAVAFSADGNTVYASQGAKYTNSGGEAWSRPWNQPSAWAAMGLKAKTGGKVAIGLAAFNDAAGTPIVLAAVWGSGLWRHDGTSWGTGPRNATIGASGSAGNQIPVTYYGNGLAFVFDRKTGIWRSTNYGVGWTLIWAKTSNDYQSGTVAYDVTRPGRLWVSAAGKLYKLGGADTGTVAGGGITGAGSDVTPAGTSAGPVACAGGSLYYVTQDTGAGSGFLLTSDDGATFTDITGGDGSFARCNSGPELIALGPVEPAAGSRRIYVSGSNVVAHGFASGSAPAGVSSAFTEVQQSSNTFAAGGTLQVWFNQAGGKASTAGTMLSARLELSDGSAAVTPADPAWQLDADIAAGPGTGVARVQIWRYPNNRGGIAGPGYTPLAARAQVPAPALAGAAPSGTGVLAGGPAAAPGLGLAQAPAVIAGTVVPAAPVVFTCSNTAATFKGKLFEYSTPPGTVQSFDQAGTASANASATSLPVAAANPNTYTGGLAVADFAAFWTVPGTGQSWTTPGGWTADGSINNTGLNFATYYQTGITAGPASVTGTINPGAGGTMTSWAAAVATYYALAATPVSITTSSVPNGTAGTAYSQSLAASGGATPYSWALASGALPAGLSLSAGGLISGTPSTPGTSAFTVQVTDAATQTASAAFSITIAAGLSVTTASLPGGITGAAYGPGGAGAQLIGSGGTVPYTWALVAGALPPGLDLTAGGLITGTPQLTGTFAFTARAADARGAQATAALAITIAAGPLAIVTTALPAGRLGQPYFAAFRATGGTGTYTWALTTGALPPGLTLNSDGTVTGKLLAAGAYPFTVTVTGI